MKVYITDALVIDLASEQWECRSCGKSLGSARENYKRFMAVRPRDPSEIHAPILDADRYEFTFAPDRDWLTIVEYYCPSCGHMAEAEYLPPGHPPVHDIEFDIDALKAQWAARKPLDAPAIGPDFVVPAHHHHKGGH